MCFPVLTRRVTVFKKFCHRKQCQQSWMSEWLPHGDFYFAMKNFLIFQNYLHIYIYIIQNMNSTSSLLQIHVLDIYPLIWQKVYAFISTVREGLTQNHSNVYKLVAHSAVIGQNTGSLTAHLFFFRTFIPFELWRSVLHLTHIVPPVLVLASLRYL
jgi:hypothetical protein